MQYVMHHSTHKVFSPLGPLDVIFGSDCQVTVVFPLLVRYTGIELLAHFEKDGVRMGGLTAQCFRRERVCFRRGPASLSVQRQKQERSQLFLVQLIGWHVR